MFYFINVLCKQSILKIMCNKEGKINLKKIIKEKNILHLDIIYFFKINFCLFKDISKILISFQRYCFYNAISRALKRLMKSISLRWK